LEDATDPTKLIDLPGQLLDKVVEVLAKVGIELPALALQLFLLTLVLLVLLAAMRPLLPDWGNAKPLPLLMAGGIALVAIGIVFGIVSHMLLPDRLVGRISGQELNAVKVELLDFRGQVVSTNGDVDAQTGEFVAYYHPVWNGRVRTLRISAPACKTRDHPIAPSRLYTETDWDFSCEKS